MTSSAALVAGATEGEGEDDAADDEADDAADDAEDGDEPLGLLQEPETSPNIPGRQGYVAP